MTSHAVFTIHCPSCSASYPVDSAKVPRGGVRARCGNCFDVFLVESAGVRTRSEPEPSPPPAVWPDTKATAPPGIADADDRAARLARVLVSDMMDYHRDRYERALERGTLREEFADEVSRSWSEYIRRVGRERALANRYFQDELNTTFAQGQELF